MTRTTCCLALLLLSTSVAAAPVSAGTSLTLSMLKPSVAATEPPWPSTTS